jgi:cytidine deaminase
MTATPDQLLEAARNAFKNAYAPYSRFQVGAALLTENGRIFTGVNVENASYGLGRCAEQSAIQAMNTAGARKFTHIHVYTEASPPSSPCGACRQVLYEFGPDASVVMSNHKGETRAFTVRELLPGAFGPEDLEK